MRCALWALLLPAGLVMSGCLGAGANAISALSLDQTTTGSIAPLSAEGEVLSDEAVVRDVVASLTDTDLNQPRPWSNALTGSAGVISGFTVLTDGPRTCREFQTTRHGFDGVSLFNGRACQRPDRGWDLVIFDRAGA